MRTGASIFLILLLALTASSPAFAERVPVRTEISGKSTLITFGWRDPVAYRHSVDGTRVTVGFSRPVEGNFSDIAARADRLVTAVRVGPDGRSVILELNRPAEVYAFYTGTAVTLELVPEEAPSVAEITGQRRFEAAQSIPADAPRVGVRTGVHPDYTRVVFDFATDVPYNVVTEDGVVTLRADAVVNVDLTGLNGASVPLLGGGRSSVADGQTIVQLAVPPTSEVRDFKSGSKVVLDVRMPSGALTPAALPDGPATASAPETASAPAAPETASAPAAPETASAPEQPAPDPVPTTAVETTEGTPAPAAATPEDAASASPATAETDGAPRALTPNAETPAPSSAEQTAEAGADPPNEELSSRAQPLDPGVQATPAKVTAFPGNDQWALRFDFDDPVAAAAFRRGGAVWIAFDKPMTVDTAALQAQVGEAAFEILQLPAPGGTVLRIRTSRRYNPAVRRDGLSWIIDLADRQLAPETPLPVNAQPSSPVGARVFIPVAEPGRPIAVADPNVGDNFVIVPVVPLGHGIGVPHAFPQFSIAPGAQGVVISPHIDDLRIRSLRQGIEIGASGVRLAISNVSADAAAHAQLAASRPMVLALEGLSRHYAPIDQFRVVRREMEAAVGQVPEKRRAAPRLELAKFYFANGYAAEALGVLRVAVADIPLLENDPGVRVMRGGSRFLLGRYDEALADLTHESVADNDEARLWAAATRAVQGDRIGSARDLRYAGSIARDYPRALKMPLGILIAEVAAETGDGQGARLFLEALNLEDPRPDEVAMLKFAEGKLMELDSDFETTIALWEDVLESENRPARARARVALTELLLKLDRISHLEAIEQYEKLRFAWRGDKMEFNNLRRLGSLYLDEGYFREGLSTLKEAATHFRDLPEAPEVTKQMSDAFNALFLGDASEPINPVKAIAIYNEFKELTPAGARGDEMIRNLADKLVQVDLLDRAAELLRAQVQFRLTGEEKARVGARLALIYLLARAYDPALEVIQGTNEPGLTDELQAQRRHLQARILMGLERPNDALALLAADESEPADILRTEIYWNAGNWLEAAKALRNVVKHSGAAKNEPLSDPQAARILNYAVALTNSRGERAISLLVQDYGAAMANTKYGEAFQLVTTPSTIGVLSPSAVSLKVDQATTFLTAYQQKLKSGVPLSSLN